MRDPDTLVAQLLRVFPQRHCTAPAAPHECLECSSIRAALDVATWVEVPRQFLQANSGVLPLLSQDAYRAFLPAWLREGILDPEGDVATMVLINLRSDPDTTGFTRSEARAIIDAAEYIGASNDWGPDDPLNIAAIVSVWSRVDA